MKKSERTERLDRDVLMTVFECAEQSISVISEAVGVSRPTVSKAIARFANDGTLCTDNKGRYFICDSYRIVLLKQSAEGTQLISVNCADKNVERVELKSVPSMSESDNMARFLGVAERHISDLLHKKYKVLSAVITSFEDLYLPRTFDKLLVRGKCIKAYLSYMAEKRSLLCLSAKSSDSHFCLDREPILSTKRKGILNSQALEGVFNMITPDLLAIDDFYLLDRVEANNIKALCRRYGVEFLGNAEAELSFVELGAVCALFEKYCEKL